ncbi:hypothetical protein NB689_000980 [Xanthomonas sacchari]|nr:hypothetical protein [Xanthomonas sacchari]
MPGQPAIAEQRGDLEVEPETAVVEVGAADQAQVLVGDQRLGVQHARAVLVDPHAGLQQLVEVRARGQGHQPRVAALGHQQAHVQPAQRRRGQRHARGLARHEIRRDQPHPPLRLVDRRHLQAVDALPRRIRPGHQHLRLDAAGIAAGHVAGPDPRHVEGIAALAGGVQPVLHEHQLQAAHHVAFAAQVQVAVGVGAQRLVLLVGDVDAAGEGDAAVDHHDLAVGAQVDPGPLELERPQQLGGMEPGHLGAGLQQWPQEALAHLRGADRIQQQAHPHPGAGALDQRVADACAGAVGIEDVVLQVHMVLGGADVAQDRLVGRGAVDQPLHRGGRTRRQAGGGLGDLGQLGAVGVGWAHAAVVLHARARAAAAQALPLHLLRAQQVIDDEAQVGQGGQRQHPAQRRRRLAFLQHDPAAQPQDVQQVGGGEVGADVRDAGQPVPGVLQSRDHEHRRILEGDAEVAAKAMPARHRGDCPDRMGLRSGALAAIRSATLRCTAGA